MSRLLRVLLFIVVFCTLCQKATADTIYNYAVTLDTSQLVGSAAGQFSIFFEFTDGSTIGDANNTVTMGQFSFGGGSALGSPVVFGGASGSLETGVAITDSSFLSFFSEGFTSGPQLSFSLGLTANDDAGGTPDRLAFFILDSSGVPLPTLAPSADYFLGVDLGSSGPVFDVWGSDPSRSPYFSISAPTVTSVSTVPEPSTIYLLGGALMVMTVLRLRFRSGRYRKSVFG
jgi:hypothetical protein